TAFSADRSGTAYAAANAELVVTSLRLDKDSIAGGDSVTARVSVTNRAKQRIASSAVSFWVVPRGASTTSTDSTRLATAQLGSLPPGATVTVVTTLNVPTGISSGVHEIVATASTAASQRQTSKTQDSKANRNASTGSGMLSRASNPSSVPSDPGRQ